MFTKQWAHLRWGVFDEIGYPDDQTYPLYYSDYVNVTGTPREVIKPTSCTDVEPKGQWLHKETKTECFINGQDALPGEKCRFVPDSNQNINSSLLSSYQYLDSLMEFCGSPGSAHIHNIIAPTRQNLICKGKSAWEVMVKHSDFLSIQQISSTTNTTPLFKVIQEVDANFALVLDQSGSMSGTRIQTLQKSAQRWILKEIAVGSSVGIISLSRNSSTLLANLTRITDDDDIRSDLADIITNTTGDNSCIGCGLQMAVSKVLNGSQNKVIILASYGEDNVAPHIKDVLDEVKNSGARVVSITFGSSYLEKMENLSRSTDGKFYLVADGNDGSLADEAFKGALVYQPGNKVTSTNIKIYEYDYQGNKSNISGSFVVDKTLGRNLRFNLDSSTQGHVQSSPILTSPNGTTYDSGTLDSRIQLWTIAVDFAESGTWLWNASLSGYGHFSINVSVTAQTKDLDTFPIYMESWTNVDSEKVNASHMQVILYARVSQGNSPVVGALAKAFVTTPNSTIAVDLLDNGQGADTQQGDGVYSRYFTEFTSIGRYTIKVQVWNNGSAYISSGVSVSSHQTQMNSEALVIAKRSLLASGHLISSDILDAPDYCCGSTIPVNPNSTTGEFSRTQEAESFDVIHVPSKRNYLPPSRITDLQVSSSGNLSYLNLSWTAPDGMDSGNVTAYEIRQSKDPFQLQDDVFESGGNSMLLLSFSNSTSLPELFVEAGQVVSLTLKLLEPMEFDSVYYVALRASDDDKKSDVSNLAPLMVTSVTTSTVSTSTVSTSTDSTSTVSTSTDSTSTGSTSTVSTSTDSTSTGSTSTVSTSTDSTSTVSTSTAASSTASTSTALTSTASSSTASTSTPTSSISTSLTSTSTTSTSATSDPTGISATSNSSSEPTTNASDPPQNTTNQKDMDGLITAIIIVGFIVAGAIMIFLIVLGCVMCMRERRKTRELKMAALNNHLQDMGLIHRSAESLQHTKNKERPPENGDNWVFNGPAGPRVFPIPKQLGNYSGSVPRNYEHGRAEYEEDYVADDSRSMNSDFFY